MGRSCGLNFWQGSLRLELREKVVSISFRGPTGTGGIRGETRSRRKTVLSRDLSRKPVNRQRFRGFESRPVRQGKRTAFAPAVRVARAARRPRLAEYFPPA